MRPSLGVWLLLLFALPVLAQQADGPKNPKAQKTFRAGLEWQQHHMLGSALDSFKKADKQDGGHCDACARKITELGQELGDYKSAEMAWAQLIADDKAPKDLALDRFGHGSMLLTEGLVRLEPEFFRQSDAELKAALAAYSKFPDAIYADGLALAPQPGRCRPGPLCAIPRHGP